MNNNSHNTALSPRDALLGVAFAAIGALVLIGTLGLLSHLAPKADAAALSEIEHTFPVPARHTYGDGVGAGRGHQGQDVWAKCGKPVLAARAGRIQFRDSDGSAGNYLVIDGRNTRVDYVYMHLRRSGLARRSEKISTGEQIGKVGSSGNASGCHLHFELWSGPGWFEGGHFLRSVTKYLRRWDRAS